MVGARRVARPRLPNPESGGSAIPREPRAGRKWMNGLLDCWASSGAFPSISLDILLPGESLKRSLQKGPYINITFIGVQQRAV